jgi:hypothetical protein
MRTGLQNPPPAQDGIDKGALVRCPEAVKVGGEGSRSDPCQYRAAPADGGRIEPPLEE